METIIIKTEGENLEKLKSLLKEMQITFKIARTKGEKDYDPDFVKKILSTKKEKSTRIVPYNIWESIMFHTDSTDLHRK